MVVGKDQIARYIPQRAPFIMIDNLLEVAPDNFTTDFRVAADNIFLEDGHLREFGLIENIAQSCAAGIGYLNRDAGGSSMDGFIGEISKLVLYGLPSVDDLISTRIIKLHQLENLYLLQGESYANGNKLMECRMKLAGLAPGRTSAL